MPNRRKNNYNISAAIKIKNAVDIAKFEKALQLLVNEQAALRSHIELLDGSVSMIINEKVDAAVHYYDVSNENNKRE